LDAGGVPEPDFFWNRLAVPTVAHVSWAAAAVPTQAGTGMILVFDAGCAGFEL
jgi:hypothetical protein